MDPFLLQHIRFWFPQFQEHALILAQELCGHPVWKNAFLRNVHRWQKVRDMESGFQAFHELVRLQTRLLVDIQRWNWNVSIALVNHMIEEEDYFFAVCQGRLSPDKERAFWAREAAQHTRLLGQMVDPVDHKSERMSHDILKTAANIDRAHPFARKYHFMKQSLRGAEKVLQTEAQHKLHLLLPDLAVKHEIREAKQGEFRLRYLAALERM
jgi:hypothetical protein